MPEATVLAATVRGQGPTVFLLHGFAQDGRAMDGLQDALSAHFRAVAVDLPGHGRSPLLGSENYCAGTVQALWDLADRLGAGQAALVGYSFGARLAAWAALARPERCWALVLESMAPRLADAERAARLAADTRLAESILSQPVSDFVARWEDQPVFSSQRQLSRAALAGQRRMRLAQDPSGLAAALAGGGQAVNALGPDQLAGLRVPTLLLAGERDAPYAAHLKRLGESIAGAEQAVVSGAGHNLQLEAEEETASRILAFLSRAGPGAGEPEERARGQRRHS